MMKNLHPNVIWLLFFKNFFSVLLIAVFFLLAFFPLLTLPLLFSAANATSFFLIVFGIIVLLIVVISYIWARLSYHYWRYQFDKEAVKIERGVIWKKYISIPYERIQNVDIYRGIMARIFGLSDLQIQTAGYSAYGNKGGMMSEGRLPGLDFQTAEDLRNELVSKIGGSKQGL